ncbi:MAG: SDR family NAD(P)-dependent oxidoreductase [Myxococcota bacterium]
MSGKPVCVVVGVGPGLGEAYARQFADAGWKVVVMSRTPNEALAREIDGLAIACDATDDDSVRAAMESAAAEAGPVHTLVWNVGSGVFGTIDDVGVDALELAWRTNVRGLFVATQAVLPGMRDAGEGNILVTSATAALRGKPFTTAFAAGKAGQKSLCESLARQLGPEGVHVAMIVVDGMVDLPKTRERMPEKPDEFFVSPAGTAAVALHLAQQPRNAWTFQLEVRPHVESW